MHTFDARHHKGADHGDEGFTIVEVLVAIALVTIVMTSLAAFFVNSARATDSQSLRQTAVQVGTDAINRARSLTSIGLVSGRDKSSSDAQWTQARDTSSSAKFPGVAAYLANSSTGAARLTEAYDTAAATGSGSSTSTPLPTSGRVVSVDNLTYTENWLLGYCTPDSSGNCTPGAATSLASYTEVIVDITYRNNACPNGLCSYVTSTLVSTSTDPTFDGGKSASRPQVNNPGSQSTSYNRTVSLPVTETGGTAPFSWAATGLPPGLTFNSGSNPVTITGKPQASGSFSVRVQLTDAFGFVSEAAFTWTTSGPVINTISSPQTATVGSSKSFNATISTSGGGTSPYSWSATGLPSGMAISGTGTTGTISGTPTASGAFNVSVTMVDANGYTDTEPVTINVAPTITTTSTSCTKTKNASGYYTCTSTFQANGANPTYTWTDNVSGADPTPTDDTSTSTITVQSATAQSFTYTVYAKDNDGITGSTNVSWKFGP